MIKIINKYYNYKSLSHTSHCFPLFLFASLIPRERDLSYSLSPISVAVLLSPSLRENTRKRRVEALRIKLQLDELIKFGSGLGFFVRTRHLVRETGYHDLIRNACLVRETGCCDFIRDACVLSERQAATIEVPIGLKNSLD